MRGIGAEGQQVHPAVSDVGHGRSGRRRPASPPPRTPRRAATDAAYRDPGWTFGTASRALTGAYNPHGYLDVYFLLGSSGKVAYINAAPASTMSQLLAHAGGLT
jgi:hypothetical protein